MTIYLAIAQRAAVMRANVIDTVVFAIDACNHDKAIIDFQAQFAARRNVCRFASGDKVRHRMLCKLVKEREFELNCLAILANLSRDRLAERFAHTFDADAIEDLLEKPSDDHADRFFASEASTLRVEDQLFVHFA